MTDFGWRLLVAIFAIALVSVLMTVAANGMELYAVPNQESKRHACIPFGAMHMMQLQQEDCRMVKQGRLIIATCENPQSIFLLTDKSQDCEKIRAFLYADPT